MLPEESPPSAARILDIWGPQLHSLQGPLPAHGANHPITSLTILFIPKVTLGPPEGGYDVKQRTRCMGALVRMRTQPCSHPTPHSQPQEEDSAGPAYGHRATLQKRISFKRSSPGVLGQQPATSLPCLCLPTLTSYPSHQPETHCSDHYHLITQSAP